MSSLWLERHPQSHLFPSCMAFWGTPDWINLALLRVLSCDETNYNIAMITQNVLAPKTNMGKYLRGGIVGLFVGPKEKKIRTLNVTTRLSLSESKVNISAIPFLKLH